MKIVIVSDTHGSRKNIENVCECNPDADMLIHLGDVEDDADYIEAIFECPTHIVGGNNDFFSRLPREEEFELEGHHIFITHGHAYYVSMGEAHLQEEARRRGADIVMYGHTHVPALTIDADLVTLNPLYSFVVYSSDAYERPMMGVSYSEDENGSRIFTCVTDDAIYEIRDMVEIINDTKKKDGMKLSKLEIPINPFGRVNIVEFERATDRTGVFERQLDELNALNILESDLCNDVSQTTQANWWGNDIELDKDDDGKVKGPQAGQWILTKTNGNGKQPNIKALVLDYDYAGVLSNIQAKHDGILERTFTPKQTEQSGGSTTGATSLSSGWTATEAVACKQSAIVKRGFKERNRLALIAIKKSPSTEPDSPLLDLKNSDIEIRPIRQKSYDMATKINSLATMIQNMVHPRVAMEAIDFFPNLAEAVEDSVPKMLEYQKTLLESKKTTNVSNGNNNMGQRDADKELKANVNPDVKRIMQDSSDQIKNSPLKDL